MSKSSSSPFPYHPQYGLSDDLRRAAVAYAKATSVKEAAIKFRVCRQSIRNWLRDYKLEDPTDVR